jgi:guanylate kinase
MNNKKGKLIIVSAPSGGGKGTVLKRLFELNPDIKFSVSATTRKPRPGEIDGVSYFYISHDRFEEMIQNNDFLEHAKYINEYYGTPREFINDCINNGEDVLLEIEVLGAKQVMEQAPDAISIFIIPPDLEELERRLRGRGTDTEEKIISRLKRAEEELNEKEHYTHIVINDEVDRAANEILSLINSH